ncbi:MAG: uroporphyrinogen-III C-methyltransferase [Armatimonadota bacterium]
MTASGHKCKVFLVGAGPGDPGLLTVKGLECVRHADVIVYDRLVNPVILKEAPSHAELIYVGKASGKHSMVQADINRLLIDKAKSGHAVVRLKGGDPFVFGRGGEEADALAESGVAFEIVPGITSAVAVPAYAGIPVTHRDHCTSFGIITGHEHLDKTKSGIKWDKIATGLDTIVFLMGVENLSNIVGELIRNGRDISTPIALVKWGTRPEQETIIGTLDDIVEKVEQTGFTSPAVIIVGDVVNLREKLQWFDNRPLFGKRVLVTRSSDQAGSLSKLLRERGAEPIEFPVIRISPPESFAEIDSALNKIESYDWLLFTSTNGVKVVMDRLRALDRDIRWLKGPQIGVIGSKTGEAIASLGVKVDFMPTKFVAEAVADEFPEDVRGKHILIFSAEDARNALIDELISKGARVDNVTAYRTSMNQIDSTSIKDMLAGNSIDVITFTSSSTVKNFIALVGDNGKIVLPEHTKTAYIGPITTQTAIELGLEPDIIAQEFTVEGMVNAIEEYFKGNQI